MPGADLDELYAAAYPRLVVQMYGLCGNLSEAEDAVQEAFVAALGKERQLWAVTNPEAWLRTVATNRLRSGWRHADVVRRYQPRVPGPQAPVEIGPLHVTIVAALARLDPDQRLVVVLHHLADLAVHQIAEELGVPEGTVKSRLARARERLAGLLADRDDPSYGEEEPRHA